MYSNSHPFLVCTSVHLDFSHSCITTATIKIESISVPAESSLELLTVGLSPPLAVHSHPSPPTFFFYISNL